MDPATVAELEKAVTDFKALTVAAKEVQTDLVALAAWFKALKGA